MNHFPCRRNLNIELLEKPFEMTKMGRSIYVYILNIKHRVRYDSAFIVHLILYCSYWHWGLGETQVWPEIVWKVYLQSFLTGLVVDIKVALVPCVVNSRSTIKDIVWSFLDSLKI